MNDLLISDFNTELAISNSFNKISKFTFNKLIQLKTPPVIISRIINTTFKLKCINTSPYLAYQKYLFDVIEYLLDTLKLIESDQLLSDSIDKEILQTIKFTFEQCEKSIRSFDIPVSSEIENFNDFKAYIKSFLIDRSCGHSIGIVKNMAWVWLKSASELPTLQSTNESNYQIKSHLSNLKKELEYYDDDEWDFTLWPVVYNSANILYELYLPLSKLGFDWISYSKITLGHMKDDATTKLVRGEIFSRIDAYIDKKMLFKNNRAKYIFDLEIPSELDKINKTLNIINSNTISISEMSKNNIIELDKKFSNSCNLIVKYSGLYVYDEIQNHFTLAIKAICSGNINDYNNEINTMLDKLKDIPKITMEMIELMINIL